ncbi:accessory factor associated with RNA polymerase II [Pseudogymnoascus destructans]|uniref:Accessory factor associated with RNA polymerase II n=1 Tax=Pseudogymnoascus destructans TaxID=655981 RepID=A0A177AJK6_9PEZI|nr:accessory factor associated with RNA polymerase II [Pseudogymnoascus destructans]OAF61481.1 accessory factor associated with RNA polymerase II [Pseudogymnoascus destructans]
MASPAQKISITDVTDTDTDHDGDADDEYIERQEGLSPQSTSTFTQQVIVSEEVTAEQGSGQVTGQITGHVAEVEVTKPTGDGKGKQPTSRKVKVSQATGTITGKLPTSKDAKQVKVSSQVTEVTATQELTNASGPGVGPSTPRNSRSIKKAISAVLDGSPFRSSLSNNEGKPLFKDSGELNSSNNSTPQPKPKPVSQTAADPPRPPVLGYEWVWFPAGYWAEREIITRPAKHIRPPKWVRKSLQESGPSTYGSTVASAPRSLNASEVWAKNPNDAEDEEEQELEGDGPRGRRAISPAGIINPDRGTSTPKALLRKLQQISHSRKASASGPSAGKGKGPQEPRPESPLIDLERQTTNTLRGTSRFFSQFLATKKQNERAMHPLSPNEQSLKLPRKRFGLAPWHQNDSGDTVRAATATSSIRELLFGKTPASTPRSDAPPAEPRPDQYFGVEVPGSRTVDDENQDAQDNTPRSLDQGSPERRRRSAIGSPLTQAGDSGPSRLFQPDSGSTLVPVTSNTESTNLRDRDRVFAIQAATFDFPELNQIRK